MSTAPVRVGGRSARFLKRSRPNRTFLEVDEYQALLDAAGALESEARSDFKGLGRQPMMATLGLAGLRISEMVDLRVAQVGLQRGRFKLADAKTDAGVREVEISLYLRDELLEHLMDRQPRKLPMEPSDYGPVRRAFERCSQRASMSTARCRSSLPTSGTSIRTRASGICTPPRS